MTAADGTTTKDYTITVTKTARSSKDNSGNTSYTGSHYGSSLNPGVATLIQNAITAGKGGTDGGLFDPQGSVTRAEACSILHKFAKSVLVGETGWIQNNNGRRKYIRKDYIPHTGWLAIQTGSGIISTRTASAFPAGGSPSTASSITSTKTESWR